MELPGCELHCSDNKVLYSPPILSGGGLWSVDQVGGLEPRLIPVQMRVSGCPLYFQMSGPRPEDQHQGPTVQWVDFFVIHTAGSAAELSVGLCTDVLISLTRETLNLIRFGTHLSGGDTVSRPLRIINPRSYGDVYHVIICYYHVIVHV